MTTTETRPDPRPTPGPQLADRVALGAMFYGTTIDEPTAFGLLDRYVDAGGEWIDTADCYAFWADPSGFGSQSELLLGRWLAGRPGVRDRVKIATKVGCECVTPHSWPERSEGLAPEVVHRVARQSLQRMGIEHIDLFWAHRDDEEVDQAATVQAFGELVADGLVGRVGHSNTALWRTERARAIAAGLGVVGPTALQLRYTYLQPRPMVRGRDHHHRFGWVTDEVLDWTARTADTTVWAYSSLLGGAYDRADKPISPAFAHEGNDRRRAELAQVAAELGVSGNEVVLGWLTGGSPAVVPIVAPSRADQLDSCLRGALLELPAELRTRLDDAW